MRIKTVMNHNQENDQKNRPHDGEIRALKVFYRMPEKNSLIFRQKLFNVNQLNFPTQNTPINVLWIK